MGPGTKSQEQLYPLSPEGPPHSSAWPRWHWKPNSLWDSIHCGHMDYKHGILKQAFLCLLNIRIENMLFPYIQRSLLDPFSFTEALISVPGKGGAVSGSGGGNSVGP